MVIEETQDAIGTVGLGRTAIGRTYEQVVAHELGRHDLETAANVPAMSVWTGSGRDGAAYRPR